MNSFLKTNIKSLWKSLRLAFRGCLFGCRCSLVSDVVLKTKFHVDF
jgi:hypothetical protein